MVIILLLLGLASAQYCPYCEYNACNQVGFSLYSCSACNSGYGYIQVQIPYPTSGPEAGQLGTLTMGFCQPCPAYCGACEMTIFPRANAPALNSLNCTSCASGYTTSSSNGTCVSVPAHCNSWSWVSSLVSGETILNCTSCNSGYGNSPLNGTCMACPSNCLTCVCDSDYTCQVLNCTSCTTTSALSGVSCISNTTAQVTNPSISTDNDTGKIVGLSIWGAAMTITACIILKNVVVFIILWFGKRKQDSEMKLIGGRQGERRQVSYV